MDEKKTKEAGMGVFDSILVDYILGYITLAGEVMAMLSVAALLPVGGRGG